MPEKIEVAQVNFWLGEHVPFEYSQYPGPTRYGERRELLIKFYKGESINPWHAVRAGTLEPVKKEDVKWPSTYSSDFDNKFW